MFSSVRDIDLTFYTYHGLEGNYVKTTGLVVNEEENRNEFS